MASHFPLGCMVGQFTYISWTLGIAIIEFQVANFISHYLEDTRLKLCAVDSSAEHVLRMNPQTPNE